MILCYLLLLSFVLSVSSNSEPDFSPSEVRECDSLVSDFLTELAIDMKSNETISLCENVTKCYESLSQSSDPAKKLAKLYRERCEKYKFIADGALDCYWIIIRGRYTSDFRVCDNVNEQEFTSTNSTKKREEFTRAKPCILKLADEYCPRRAVTYLKSNFDEFVSFIAADRKNETCESVSVEVGRAECWHVRATQGQDWYKGYKWYNGLSDVPDTSYSMELCRKVKLCNEDPCKIYNYQSQLLRCEIIEKLGTNFYSCLRDSRGSLHPVSVKSCEKNDRECIKKTIMKNCKVNESEFEENYEWFNKYDMRKLYKIEIDEFKSNGTDYGDSQWNGIVSDNLVGTCAPIVDEMVTFLSRDTEVGFYKNSRLANETCSKVMECYMVTNTPRDLQASIQQMCDIVEMTSLTLNYDLMNFYENEHNMGHNVENNDFFSRNLTLRREAFISARSNMTQTAKHEWGGRELKFLRSNYEKFLDWMTEKPETNTCKSVFGINENVHCVEGIDTLVNIINFNRLTGEEAVKIIEECRLFNKCMEGAFCPNAQTTEIANWCESAKTKGIYFLSCVDRVRLEETDYSCSKYPIIQETTAEHFLREFKSSRDCLKQLMEKRCGADGVKDFDKYFDHILNRDL